MSVFLQPFFDHFIPPDENVSFILFLYIWFTREIKAILNMYLKCSIKTITFERKLHLLPCCSSSCNAYLSLYSSNIHANQSQERKKKKKIIMMMVSPNNGLNAHMEAEKQHYQQEKKPMSRATFVYKTIKRFYVENGCHCQLYQSAHYFPKKSKSIAVAEKNHHTHKKKKITVMQRPAEYTFKRREKNIVTQRAILRGGTGHGAKI